MSTTSELEPDALLDQATCAVLVSGEVRGSAWLLTDDGHLLTAGHVLGNQRPSKKGLSVQFTGEKKSRKVNVIDWRYSKADNVDYALLQLVGKVVGRRPLPVKFLEHVDGRFRLQGYGATLIEISSGKGEFIGPVGTGERRLFRLRSQELTERGYSGGAVFSDGHQAVVAIQTEALDDETLASSPTGRDTVLAMPLFRVLGLSEELQSLEAVLLAHSVSFYRYHVFLSYPRSAGIATWVSKFFRPELEQWLGDELSPEDAKVFWDQDNDWEQWGPLVQDAILRSCCLVPLLGPGYRGSPQCLAEWESFRRRESAEAARLVMRVKTHPRDWHSPDGKSEGTDLSDHVITADGFKTWAEFGPFQRKVRQCAAELAELVSRAPACKTTWPLIPPADTRQIAEAVRVNKVPRL